MKVMTTRHQLHMHYLHYNGFGLSLIASVSSMILWHDQQCNYKNLINVKVNNDSGDRVVSVNLTHRKVQQLLESSNITYDNMLWLKRRIRSHGARLKRSDD